MLYTRKGDLGTTKFFGCCDQRISKSSATAEALGALDEINSLLGFCKVKADATSYTIHATRVADIVGGVQQNLFIIQAEMAGVDKTITQEKVEQMEKIIDGIEKELPTIKTFFVAGGTELAALFDFARTVARRAERRVVEAAEKGESSFTKASAGERKIGQYTLAYLNRLSSLLYALSRYANHRAGVKEQPPEYK